MINREYKKAILREYGGVDEYGQMLTSSVDSREIEITFGLFTHSETSDVRYQQATHTGLTKDKEINDKQTLAIGEEEYKIVFVNPYGRLTQVFMRKK